MIRATSLLLALLTMEFPSKNVLAQPSPVILTLKGVGVGPIAIEDDYYSHVQVVENRAFVAWAGRTNNTGGFEVFDVSAPTVPVRIGGYESRAPVNAIQVVGSFAYLALNTGQTFTDDAGALEIVGVSDPSQPIRLGDINTAGRANGIQVVGDYAYIPESTRWKGSNLLGLLEIFNVSDPTNPVRVGAFGTAGHAVSVSVRGSFAYLADGVIDLQVLDVSEPSKPTQVGDFISDVSQNQCGFENGGPAHLVSLKGNLAYSAGENGVQVLDLSAPSKPRLIGNNFCYPSYGFQISENYGFTLLWSVDRNTFRLGILDTSDPANLAPVAWQQDWPSPFCVADRFIYSGAGHLLLIYEISDAPSIKTITRSGQILVLTWNAVPGFRLQQTASLDDPIWSDVPGTEGLGQLELPVEGSNGFFRLARP